MSKKDARKNYLYKQQFVRRVVVPVNRRTEHELLMWLEAKPNISGYIKELIRRDIEETKQYRAQLLRVFMEENNN